MNVSVLVCTYGSALWAERGRQAGRDLTTEQGQDETIELHLPDATLSEVRNQAAQGARGDWLCFLDADDRLAPGYLHWMRRAHERPRRTPGRDELLVPAVHYLDPVGVSLSAPMIPAWGRPIEEINCAVIGTLVPRALFLDVGGFPEEPIYEDWACWLACIRAGATLVPVPEARYRAHVRPGSRNAPSPEANEVYWRRRREHEQWLAVQGTELA